MKNLALAIAFLVTSVASAAATCTGPAIMHDFAGTAFNMSLATNAGDGNCGSNVLIVGTLPAYAATPTFNIGTAPTIAVTGTFFQGTQPISAASLPLPTGAATSANQTNASQKTQIVDGSGNIISSTNNAANTFSQAPTVTFGSLVKGTTAAMTGTTTTQVIAAVTSQRIYVMSVHCNNSSSTATLVALQDGSGGTTLDTLICPAGGGDERNASMPMIWTTAGNALFAADVTTGASVIVQASGYSSAN